MDEEEKKETRLKKGKQAAEYHSVKLALQFFLFEKLYPFKVQLKIENDSELETLAFELVKDQFHDSKV